MKWGRLRLRTLGLTSAGDRAPGGTTIDRGGKAIAHKAHTEDRKVRIDLDEDLVLQAGETLRVTWPVM